jgi:AraC-like DNA-binding protein
MWVYHRPMDGQRQRRRAICTRELRSQPDVPPIHAIHFLKPALGLQQHIRFYCQREVRLESAAAIVHPVPARAAPMIEFIFGDRFKVQSCASAAAATAFSGVVVGLQTFRRVELVMRGTLDAFSIFFQPSGLHRLFCIPMHELTNHHYEARAVLGASISQLEQRLGACKTFEGRAQIADHFLFGRRNAADADGVSASANEILRRSGRILTPDLAYEAGLSLRQFERRFRRQVGMRPKLYARIARFEGALDRKARSRAKSWTEVAQEFGYHDQMHLVHDFREFSGETPTNTLTHVERSYRAQIEATLVGRTPAFVHGEPPLIL